MESGLAIELKTEPNDCSAVGATTSVAAAPAPAIGVFHAAELPAFSIHGEDFAAAAVAATY